MKMTTRDIADICVRTKTRSEAYHQLLRKADGRENFKEMWWVLTIADKLLDAEAPKKEIGEP